jgi:hypothetical protein
MAAQYHSVNDIINRAAIEMGLWEEAQADVLAMDDGNARQLRYLLDGVGQELVRMYPWEQLHSEHSITTDAADSGDYTLPSDFGYIVPQTEWNRTDDLPVIGTASPQEWQYLEGRDLQSTTVYIHFRLQAGKFSIYPNSPVPDDKNIYFEYIRDTWLSNAAGNTYYQEVQIASDLVEFDRRLAVAFLKVKFLEAKGFDSQKPRDDFNDLYEAITGQSKSAPILNLSGRRPGFAYLDLRNVPHSGYG